MRIAEAEMAVQKAQRELAAARAALPPEEVEDYELLGEGGKRVRLSEMFGNRTDLIVVHNMGRSCPSCTLWADEFNGVLAHLVDRAPFVITSPDSPQIQAEFAKSRGWKFEMYSTEDTRFPHEMGFYNSEGDWIGYMPGVSTFDKAADGRITRVASSFFGPGDAYCGVWHILELLKDGVDGWEPKFEY